MRQENLVLLFKKALYYAKASDSTLLSICFGSILLGHGVKQTVQNFPTEDLEICLILIF